MSVVDLDLAAEMEAIIAETVARVYDDLAAALEDDPSTVTAADLRDAAAVLRREAEESRCEQSDT